MHTWYREVPSLSQSEILAAVKNDAWQRFRQTLKGLSTEDKLDALEGYCQRREEKGGRLQRSDIVRVANYINALLRGGQLRHGNNGTIVVHR